MTLEAIYDNYRRTQLFGVQNTRLEDGLDHFYAAVLAFSEGEIALACGYADSALKGEPANVVFAEALVYLARIRDQGKQSVYVTGQAFADFIRGGGNLGLYAATSQALQAVYREYESLKLLDVGVGDGMALLPALIKSVAKLDLIEPSGALLDRTKSALIERGFKASAFEGTLQAFMAAHPSGDRWDVIEATFSLQSVTPTDRPDALQWLRQHGGRVLVAEFDVPDYFEEMFAPARVRQIVSRYKIGLAEYANDNGKVAQGFLMPVMFGYFDPTMARTNYEQPIRSWVSGLQAAGFSDVRATMIYPYWWADAYLIDAKG